MVKRINGLRLDWDMRDWDAEDSTVGGLVGALEGCGEDDTPVVLVAEDGRELRLLGVGGAAGRVHIIASVKQSGDSI